MDWKIAMKKSLQITFFVSILPCMAGGFWGLVAHACGASDNVEGFIFSVLFFGVLWLEYQGASAPLVDQHGKVIEPQKTFKEMFLLFSEWLLEDEERLKDD